jgi:hypothetical protein
VRTRFRKPAACARVSNGKTIDFYTLELKSGERSTRLTLMEANRLR